MRRAALLLLLAAACSKGKGGGGGGSSAEGDYLRKSKSVEAKINLKSIERGILASQAENGTLPDSIPMTPALGACCQSPDRKCPAEPQVFAAAGWDKVDFSPSEPHYYSYELVSSPGQVIIRAKGDLDCNGVYSTFEETLTAQAGELRASGLMIDHELE